MNWRWLVRRIGMAGIVIYSTITLTFFLLRFMPGSPVSRLRVMLYQRYGTSMSQAEINRMVELYLSINPDKPLVKQYIDYVLSILQGDFGQSLIQGEPVMAIIGPVLPWTVFVMSIGIMLMYIFGIIFGSTLAYAEGSRFDQIGSSLSIIVRSTPFYVAAFLLVFIFGFQLRILPTGGRISVQVEPGTLDFYISAIRHAALPIASLVITGTGGVALQMRANSIQVLGSDYLRGAKLRGLSDFRQSYRYVARNAILPLYTGLLIRLGYIFGGSVILEQIFAYRGLGWVMLDSVLRRDYPIVMACFILITVAVVIGMLIADLTYGKLDPRIQQAGGEA